MSSSAEQPSPSASWLAGLAAFLHESNEVEAILLDPGKHRLSLATLGHVDEDQLRTRLEATLRAIEEGEEANTQTMTPLPGGIQAKPIPGEQMLLEKPACPTAPRFWAWREMPWLEGPTTAPAASGDEPAEWRFLAVMAGLCGASMMAAFLFHRVEGFPEWGSVALYLLAMVLGGFDAARDAVEKLRQRQVDIHFLMLAVAVGASLIGAYGEGALLLFLFSLSGALEDFALHRTRREIDTLFKVAPRQAWRLAEDGSESLVPVEKVGIGDRLMVRPGDVFAVDGEIESGTTAADESNLTGEANPVSKPPGAPVYSGTINLWGAVEIRVSRPASESALSRIIRLIQEAQHLKAPSQRFTDRFGTSYTLGILALVTVMFFVWWLGFGLPPFTNSEAATSAFYRAMTLLVVASPCALVLSIPSAILAAIAWGARHGVLFRGGAAIEKLAEVDLVAVDKTGTFTTGELEVNRVESFPAGQERTVLELAYALERRASHPIARALVQYGRQQGVSDRDVENFRNLTGKGVQGTVEDGLCVLGRRELLELGPLADWAARLPQPASEFTEVWVIRGELLGRILLRDQIRSESRSVLDALKDYGLRTVMLTGDRRETAETVGKGLGLDEVRAALQPEDKVAAIREFSRNRRKVAMIGDGVNDAPSLAAAYVSVAMGARGSDAALEQSEVILMKDRIDNFLNAYRLSRQARHVIRQNLVLSLGTVVVMVLASIFGLIPLSVGVFAHEGSTVLVCLNSLRLLFKRS